MLYAWTLLICCTIPGPTPVLRDRVDVIERNEFYDDDGRRVFQQAILWDSTSHGLQVVAWRLDHGEFTYLEHPPAVIWVEGGKVRHVSAGAWRRTFLQYDPELAAREQLPQERRRGLSK